MEWERLLSPKRFVLWNEGEEVSSRSDYDTIICSTLFRRLQDKAQVFPLEEDDYVRTRLTHSLEVSAIGKRLGEYVFGQLKASEIDPWFQDHSEKEFSDVLLCAGLVHDIGNPPFGHFGEYAVREWFQANLRTMTLGQRRVTELLSEWQREDLYRFEGNAQSLRLLSGTPYLGRMEGFNLSYRVLAAIIKYPVSSEELKNGNLAGYKKMGYNCAEKELFDRINQETGMNGCRHPLSYLLEAADDIAYRTSDLEDAMVKKVLTLPQIMEGLRQYLEEIEDSSEKRKAWIHVERLRKLYEEEVKSRGRKPELTAVQRWNQSMQKVMIEDAAAMFVTHYRHIMEGCLKGDLFEGTVSGHIINAIARLSENLIYTSSVKIRTELFGRRVIDSLLSQFMPAAVKYDTGEAMTFIDKRTMDIISGFYKSMYHGEAAGRSEGHRLYLRMLMVTDYISGMTDNYARRLYRELFA